VIASGSCQQALKFEKVMPTEAIASSDLPVEVFSTNWRAT
jgi:hypothetical protein